MANERKKKTANEKQLNNQNIKKNQTIKIKRNKKQSRFFIKSIFKIIKRGRKKRVALEAFLSLGGGGGGGETKQKKKNAEFPRERAAQK